LVEGGSLSIERGKRKESPHLEWAKNAILRRAVIFAEKKKGLIPSLRGTLERPLAVAIRGGGGQRPQGDLILARIQPSCLEGWGGWGTLHVDEGGIPRKKGPIVLC